MKTFTVHNHKAFNKYLQWTKTKAKYKLLLKLRKIIDKEIQELGGI